TSHLSDLTLGDKALVVDLAVPLAVELDAGSDGKSYLVRVSSDIVTMARARQGRTVTASSCRVLKSRSSVKCAVGSLTPVAPTTTSAQARDRGRAAPGPPR